MTATDDRVRHVAVIMASPASGRSLLGLLSPLFESGGRFEVQGVFLEDADAGSAAGLPFVKEVCRVTFSVREFTSDQFERSVALSVRTARRTFSVLAARTGQPYSFRNVRRAVRTLSATLRSNWSLVNSRTLLGLLAPLFASGDRYEVQGVFLEDADASHAASLPFVKEADTADLRDLVPGVLPRKPAALRYLKGDPFAGLCDVSRELGGTLAVLSARFALERPGSLQRLRAGMPCPVCLVSDEAVANAA
ncbi:MAG: hypothetical protein P8Y54_13455 [Xanthomonadales bacterium]